MPRRPRIISSTGVYHFINRGINKKKIFHKEADYRFYIALVREYSAELGVRIYHYCLMGNHTHFLVRVEDMGILSRFSHFLHRRYTYYYCKTYHWSEQLFNRRFLSLPIEEEGYLLECGRYIERNPVRAGFTKAPQEYLYSSYNHYTSDKIDPIVTDDPLYDQLGSDVLTRRSSYAEYVSQARPYEELVDRLIITNYVPADLVR